jgi:16S rRNA (adenine1518-N6/adenine1519-N6)-dimethyltransferase
MTDYGHRARKRFGQNFLNDPELINRIVASIHPQADDLMVEIGPGQGALTGPLLDRLNQLQVIELDRDLIPILKIQFATRLDKLQIHQADALRYDYSQLLANSKQPLRVVGNLPYNISTPLLFHLLDYRQQIADMHFMLQLEVVARICAEPGSKTYGRLSVMSQYYCEVEQLFEVPPEAFDPMPKVTSAIIRLKPYSELPHPARNEALLQTLLQEAFSKRRKTLRNTVKNLVPSEQLDNISTDLSLRPEQLSMPEFVTLANQIDEIKASL